MSAWVAVSIEFEEGQGSFWQNLLTPLYGILKGEDEKVLSTFSSEDLVSNLIEFFFQMYRIYKAVYAIKTEQNKTWEECCLRVPVVNIDKMIEEELDGKRRRRRMAQEDDWDFSDFEEDDFVEKTDMCA